MNNWEKAILDFNRLEKKVFNLEQEALNSTNLNDLREKWSFIEQFHHQLHKILERIWESRPEGENYGTTNDFRRTYDQLTERMKERFIIKSNIISKLLNMKGGHEAYMSEKTKWEKQTEELD